MPSRTKLIFPLLLPVLLAGLALYGLLASIHTATAAPLVSTLYASATGSGAACTVPSPCQLQTAISNAVSGDTILVQGGTYTGTGPAVITVSKSITLLGGWNGVSVGPAGLDPNAYPTTLTGQNSRRVVGITGNVTPTLSGFIITAGNATGLTGSCSPANAKGCGGGVFVTAAHVRLYNNTFISNTALVTTAVYGTGQGGGVHLDLASGAIVSGNLFLNNPAMLVQQGHGGGLSTYGNVSVTVENNTFRGNSATWGAGAAIGYSTYARVINNLFDANTANLGSGLFAWVSFPTVLSNTFTGNTLGAPLYLGFVNSLVQANRILNNPVCVQCAGIELVDGYAYHRITLVNNIVVNSGHDALSAFGHGGGPLYAYLIHNTFVGDGSVNNNGIHVTGGHVTMTLTNTLLVGVVTGFRRDYPLSGTVKSNSTLFDTSVISHGTATEVGSLGGAALATVDGTIAPGSAAQDAGLPTNITIDFQGDTRPQGPLPDIGADEVFTRRVYLPLARK